MLGLATMVVMEWGLRGWKLVSGSAIGICGVCLIDDCSARMELVLPAARPQHESKPEILADSGASSGLRLPNDEAGVVSPPAGGGDILIS